MAMLRVSRRQLLLRTLLVLTLVLAFSLLQEYYQLQDIQVRLQQQTHHQDAGDTGSVGGGKSISDVTRLWKGPSEPASSSTASGDDGSSKESNVDGAAAQEGAMIWDLVRHPWSWTPSSSSSPSSPDSHGDTSSSPSSPSSSTDTPAWGVSKFWPWKSSSSSPSSSSSNDIFDFGPIRSGAIRAVCKDTEWNSTKLVFTCDGPVGGVGNIRNSILNCVRYAIHAGAAIVEPRIVLRMTEDISVIRTGVTTEMAYMFETEHFYESLRESCPQMKIYRSRKDIVKEFGGAGEEDGTEEPNEGHEKQNEQNEPSLLPESLTGDVPQTGISSPETWRQKFYGWLDQTAPPPRTAAGPIIVNLERSYLQYPVLADGEDFAHSFGGLLKFRSDIRVLATTTLRRLVEMFSLDVTEEDLARQDAVLPRAFFGAHLRTEKDAREAWPGSGWTYSRYETQASLYLDQAPRSEPMFIYVASGDQAEVARFASDADLDNHHHHHNNNSNGNNTTKGWKVVTKFDVLGDEDLGTLKALAWDQQGMVDFLVMLKASDFAGIAHSSFAWNVALKRHMMVREKEGYLDGPQMLSDDLSQIYGEPRGYPEYAACMWA